MDLREHALAILMESAPESKVQRVQALFHAVTEQHIAICAQKQLTTDAILPGRPEQPILVDPKTLPRRHLMNIEGRAVLLHALTHIEFNAINLALDAIWRFADLPVQYYRDWLRVAAEEASHFTLLSDRLQQLGYAYGMFAAHNGLWEMCARTQDSCLARMALVPRTLEARGLDVSPAIRARLLQVRDQASADVLQIILEDEIGHVKIGNDWFAYLCAQQGVESEETYLQLLREYRAPPLKGPMNIEARRQAGFTARFFKNNA